MRAFASACDSSGPIRSPSTRRAKARRSHGSSPSDEEILQRLVAFNAERAAEEQRGLIRWLRPEFQCREPAGVQQQLAISEEVKEKGEVAVQGKEKKDTAAKKLPWPKSQAERTKAIQTLLAKQTQPITPEQLARRFQRAREDSVAVILEALASLGLARKVRGGAYRA
jgi:hypothetical protein